MHTTESLKVSNTYFIVFTVHLCLILIGDVLDNKRFHKNYTEAVLHQRIRQMQPKDRHILKEGHTNIKDKSKIDKRNEFFCGDK